MPSAPLQPRPTHRPALSTAAFLVALLLAVLQTATPFAHAMVHAAAAGRTQCVPARQHSAVAWNGTAAEEKPCALCAADQLPALPESARAVTGTATVRFEAAAVVLSVRSTAPLDLFCRPPPTL